jgi:hypothetical protein
MTSRIINTFNQFILEADGVKADEPTLNEPSDSTESTDSTESDNDTPAEIKAVPFAQMMETLAKLAEIPSSDIAIGTPADIYGHSTSYKTDLSEVENRLADINHYYETKLKQDVNFYCWNVTWKDYTSGREMLKKLPSGTVDEYKYINLDELIKYFEQNPEDAGLLKGINITVKSKAADDFGKEAEAVEKEDTQETT